MRITSVLILAACVQVSGRAQGEKVTLDAQNAPLVKLFKSIEQQTGYAFLYNTLFLEKASAVTIKVKDLPLQKVLELCFEGQPLTYKIQGKSILVGKKEERMNFSPDVLFADSVIDIGGRVFDESGVPLGGATVNVKNSKIATSTFSNGRFLLKNVSPNSLLLISYIGYESLEVMPERRGELTIRLKNSNSKLDEVQVIAYGTTTQRLNTGNISSVKAADIEKQPVNNSLLALEGRVPGLVVTQANGIAGGGVTVRIQGTNSIGSGNDPLYIVDGVPYVSQMLSTTKGGMSGLGVLGNSGGTPNAGRGNPLSYINPSDILSIDVLKDADATAIYGSRAANGAILITTKKGKAGELKTDLNFQQGISKVTNKVQLLNTKQYLEMRREAFKNDVVVPTISNAPDLLIWDTTRFTDWQKTLIGGTSHYTNINASISGGSVNVQYLIASTYYRETTVFPGNFNDQKGSLQLNITSLSINQKFKAQLSANYMLDNNKLPTIDFTTAAVGLSPDAPALYNPDGTLNWSPNSTGTSTWTNPFSMLSREYENKTTNLISNATFSYQVIKGLEVKTSLGYNNLHTKEFQSGPLVAIAPELRANSVRNAYYSNSNISAWIIEPQVSYKNSFKGRKLEFLLGATVQQKSTNGEYLTGGGYNSDQVLKDIKSASTITVSGTERATYKYNAIFSRLNYNLRDKYIANLTVRRDGSSRFGAYSQFHNFSAIGVAWIFSEENFVKNKISFLSFGKLKGSYGTTGNDQIDDYQFMNLYAAYNPGVAYQGLVGLIADRLPNQYLQWEETKKMQFGIELGFVKDRILLIANYINNTSSNQLLSYSIPLVTGFASILSNFPATIKNTAYEFLLSATVIKSKSFKWYSSLNLTIPKNRVSAFPNIEQSTYASGQLGVIVGQPYGVRKVYNYIGVNKNSGLFEFEDKTGKPTVSPNSSDMNTLISTLPKYYGGLSNAFEYKSFQLDFLIQFTKQIGSGNFSFRNIPGRFLNGTNNQPATALNRWQKNGDDNRLVQKFSQGSSFTLSQINYMNSSASFPDCSFLRLKNVSFSYAFPEKMYKKMRIKNGSVFIQGQNLITITKFTGLDPETQTFSSLPPLKTVSIGFKATI